MPPILPRIHIKQGREKKILSAYPWVQKEEATHIDECLPGDLAHLIDSEGNRIAVGTLNPKSRFPFRVLSLKDEPIDVEFFIRRMKRAEARRSTIHDADGMRMAFSEADGMPGLILDRYQDVWVVQVRSAGIERLKPMWMEALHTLYKPACLYERSEMDGRRDEGLPPFAGLLTGQMPEEVVTQESGITFEVPVVDGLKTGFYLDQRNTRRRLAQRIIPGQRVLDTFCYSGAFSLHAAKAGATVTGVDLNTTGVAVARRNAERNKLEATFIEANAFEYLGSRPMGELYDWIVLDPPAIAKSKEKRDSLKWGIWKLVHAAADHLKDGGRLIVCNCSYQFNLADTIDVIRLAASDRGRNAFVEEVTVQDLDHPYLTQFPESLYLKCVWVRLESRD